jgi:hypothetical protein
MARRYTRSLEAEVARLRAENRALLNSILGIAGVPPIRVEAAESAGIEREAREGQAASGSGPEGQGVARPQGIRRGHGRQAPSSSVGVPFRRRSWYQINRALEIDAARKNAGDAEAEPNVGIAVKNG